MRKLVVLWAAVVVGAMGAWGSQLGLGLGFSEWGLGGGEVWAEFRPKESLAWRLSVTLLTPVLPGEAPAVAFQAGGRWAAGEALQVVLAAAGGALVEGRSVGGPALGWVVSATAGLKWLWGTWGLYASTSAYFALRPTPMGTVFYPYFLYTLGLVWGT